MQSIARGGINAVAPILILLLLGSPAAAQDPKPKNNVLENLALCNGIDRTSPELQINGCTAIIDLSEHTAAAAIAYNNRGNAYAEKGDYDRAVQDFDQSIKLNPTNAKPFNNSGVAYLKKGEYELAIKNLDEAIRLDPNYVKAFVNRAETYQKSIVRPATMERSQRFLQRQRIANARAKPIEANKNQAVDGAEGLFVGSGSPQNVYLLPQRPNFRLERCPRPKQIYHCPNNEPDKIYHPANSISRFSINCQSD
jgi:tetratricopeptide (TPR) repeat protein